MAVRTRRGWRAYRFVLDTGAYFTLAPRHLAEEVGLAWGSLPEARLMGVELGGIVARLGRVPLRIGSVELSVRRLFVDAPSAPFLLARADSLERFATTIDTEQAKITLRELPSR